VESAASARRVSHADEDRRVSSPPVVSTLPGGAVAADTGVDCTAEASSSLGRRRTVLRVLGREHGRGREVHDCGFIRLAASSRERPALPLGRLRAAGDLFELDGSDLALTEEETAALLERTTGRTLDADVGIRSTRTGSAGGAAPRTDTLVFELLAEEVYVRQPAGVRAFLDDTCVLETL
jgi:hypothetical protein